MRSAKRPRLSPRAMAMARYRQTIDALMLELCRTAAVFDERRGYLAFGCNSTVEWMVKRLGITDEDAASRLWIGKAILRGERRLVRQ